MPMLQLAQHILDRAHAAGRGITNLHLQQILYFTLIDALKQGLLTEETLAEIYTDQDAFEAWAYGPVEVNVYRTYKPYGSCYIVSDTCQYPQYQFLDDIIDELIETEVFSLVDESCTHPFWETTFQNKNATNIRYSLADLLTASKGG
ncbi:MAG: hypothetical protein D8B54_02225 [Catonella sp.]|nr:MAG: hypothetical protein D8B54_02225 [Catonella sp.]